MDLVLNSCSKFTKGKCNNSVRNGGIISSQSPVWILGRCYNPMHDSERITSDINSRIWFTYRKDFPAIGTGVTSDRGWGCMLRCGQMVMAEAIQRIRLGRSWIWPQSLPGSSSSSSCCHDVCYILQLFLDIPDRIFGIQQISLMAQVSGYKPVGTWFGPNTIVQVLRKLVLSVPRRLNSDSRSDLPPPLVVHVALNNILVIDDVRRDCVNAEPAVMQWTPLFLAIPLRLGLTEMNPIYFSDLKECLEMEACVGVLGGRPNHAMVFIGYVDDELLCLDPHLLTQDATWVSPTECMRDQIHTFHTDSLTRIHISDIDPSLALCFLCLTEAAFDELCRLFICRLVRGHSSPLFEVCRQSPSSTSSCILVQSPLALEVSKSKHKETSRRQKSKKGGTRHPKPPDSSDNDEEFELL